MKNLKFKIKIIVIMILVSFIIPQLDSFNLMTVTAYASSYELTNIQLETNGGRDIQLYKYNDYSGTLNSDTDLENKYYAKVSASTSKVVLNTSGTNKTVKIFKSKSSKIYDSGDEIPLFDGLTTFYIRIYDTYDSSKPTNCQKEYKIFVKKYTDEEEKSIQNDSQDEIYLHTIQFNNGDIPLSFDRKIPSYNIKVNDDIKSILIKAEPDDGATTVKINNVTVDENNNYKKNVNLDEGNNVVEISLSQDDEEKRIYTLNIDREKIIQQTQNNQVNNTNDINKSTTNNVTVVTSDINQPNKWVKVSDKWHYNDSYGNPVKNNWYYDSSYGKKYYFDNYGNMVVGWVSLNSNWYYLNNTGAMETGWKRIGNEWYYLEYNGKMKTGWFKDVDGKYYYLNETNGAMAHDTKIGGYKLGSNGVWNK